MRRHSGHFDGWDRPTELHRHSCKSIMYYFRMFNPHFVESHLMELSITCRNTNRTYSQKCDKEVRPTS